MFHCTLFILSGIYKKSHVDEAPADGTNSSSTSSAQTHQQPQQTSSRLSGSEYKSGIRSDTSSGGFSSSSINIGVGSGSVSSTASTVVSGGGSSFGGSGDSPTPPLQHRRLAKSFSVAPSMSQTKGAL